MNRKKTQLETVNFLNEHLILRLLDILLKFRSVATVALLAVSPPGLTLSPSICSHNGLSVNEKKSTKGEQTLQTEFVDSSDLVGRNSECAKKDKKQQFFQISIFTARKISNANQICFANIEGACSTELRFNSSCARPRLARDPRFLELREEFHGLWIQR